MHGPLWTHSAFMYEDFHQQIKKFVKSLNSANLQILQSFRTRLAFFKLYNLYNDDSTISQRNWLDGDFKQKRRAQASLIIGSGNVHLLEKAEQKNLSDGFYLAFQRINIDLERNSFCTFYKRIIFNKELVVSQDYTGVKKRNSYTVILNNDEIF